METLVVPGNGQFAQICVGFIFLKCISYIPVPVFVTRGIFWLSLFTVSPDAYSEYGVFKTQMFGNPSFTLLNITISGLLPCGFSYSEGIGRFAPTRVGLSFEKSFLIQL